MANETTATSTRIELSGARQIAESAPSAFTIKSQIEAIETNLESQPELALDLCRALIETVCKTVLADLGETIPSSTNAEELVPLVLKRFSIFADPKSVDDYAKQAVGDTVTGINKFVNGIGKYRRLFGTASHGRDGYTVNMDISHARMVAGVTDALVLFIYETHRRLHGTETWERAFYGDHPDYDQYLDDEHDPSPIPIFGDEHRPSEVFFGVNPSGYVKRLNDWRKLQAEGEIEADVDTENEEAEE